MPDLWVCNASPLILLNRIGNLILLTGLCETLVIPKAVINEVLRSKEDPLVWETFFASPRVKKAEIAVPIDPAIAGWDLGKGESEVLSYAVAHSGSEAILDDLAARKCARSLGIPLRGTVGIILLAKKRSQISKASPLIQSLIDAGLRCDRNWINEALELIGEELEGV